MKRIIIISLALVLVVALIAAPVMAGGGKFSTCTKIQDGTLTYSAGHYLAGEPLKTGYDIFGYNYQAHIFNDSYANAYLGRYGWPPYCGDDDDYEQRLEDEGYTGDPYGTWYWQDRDVQLQMKWNDAWLSNMDCDLDGILDRHYGFASYIGSGAWLTNHQKGEDEDGKWAYFVKIVAVPEDAYADGGIWFTADDTEIGPAIWGQFAIIQEVSSGEGVVYLSPAGPGFGKW